MIVLGSLITNLSIIAENLSSCLRINICQLFHRNFRLIHPCIYYCVGTPYGEGGEADLTYLYQAIDTTLQACRDDKYRVLVTKSTIPPSTTAEKVIP